MLDALWCGLLDRNGGIPRLALHVLRSSREQTEKKDGVAHTSFCFFTGLGRAFPTPARALRIA